MFLLGEGLFFPHPDEYAACDPILATMSSLTGGGSDTGHRVHTLVNGDQIFPAMLEAIASARASSVSKHTSTGQESIGLKFATALATKAQQGVPVRVLVDAVGSIPFDQNLIDIMVNAGVSFERFRPIHWYTLDRLNNRTHRKLLIVDGSVGFTGGVGIGDQWLGNARNAEEWRDTHYRITGPAVSAMQAAFAAHWLEATGEVLQGRQFYPPPSAAGSLSSHLVLSSKPEGSSNMHLMMLMAIAAAERHIRIGMAYFVPDDITIEQLLDARRRGVEIDVTCQAILLTCRLCGKGSRYFWGVLLQAGVRIHEYHTTMYHPKILIVDEAWVTVGSANLDDRSLRLNDEANVNVYGDDFAREQAAIFHNDLSRSREITLQEWASRPTMQKITDWFASLLRSQI